MTPDKTKTYLVSISGGKDSTAMWLHLKYDLGLPNIIPIFADTGWEHDLTYKYLDYLETKLGPLVRVKPVRDFVELAKHKKRFPSTKARFCTEHLKMKPTRAWIRDAVADGRLVAGDTIQCSGVRHEESPARKAMAEWVDVDDYYGLRQWRPIITWTWAEVFAMHDKHGVDANPLYKHGMGRVGCMPCVMSNKAELKEIGTRFPEVIDKVEAAEAYAGRPERPSTFFVPNMVPPRFRSVRWKNAETGEVFRIATARDVFAYVQLEKEEKKFGGELPKLFEEPANEDVFGTCSSIYGLCE